MTGIAILLLSALVLTEPTPAEERIAAAGRAIASNPDHFEAHNQLALAFARRARETADHQYYERALEALETSFRLSPDNYHGLRIRAWVALGQHQFADALKRAQALNERAPDDVLVYAFLADAHVELGDYESAETAAQGCSTSGPETSPA